MKNPIARSELEAVKKKVALFLQVHRYEAAEKLLKSTLSAYGSLANLHNLLGLTYHKQSRFVDAIEQFELARKDNPNYTEATLNLTATLCDLSRYEEAREIYETLKSDERTGKRHPKMVLGRIANMHASLARTYQECNMLPEAIQEYTKALTLFHDMPDVLLESAKLLIRAGHLPKAQSRLEELVKENPHHLDARTLLGLVYYKAGRLDLAKDQWAIAQQSSPDHTGSRLFLQASQSNSAP